MKTGMIVMAAGLLFLVAETIWFGCNWMSSSRTELLCDIWGSLTVLAGGIIYKVASGRKP
jgi:hypothetical protein